jgi:TetR/AcrR family transcriptional repressor of bet genes
MPKTVDHEQRRRELAEALWRIARRDGLEAATVRHVAAEAGASVGLVQHYFTSKDEMLQFALERLGAELEARLISKITALGPEPDPYEVIWIVMCERLPLTNRRQAQTQVMVAWLGRVALRRKLNRYLVDGTVRIRDYLASQLLIGQQRGEVRAELDPSSTADALLCLNEGLAAQLVVGIHTATSSRRVLADHLALLFSGRSTTTTKRPTPPAKSGPPKR